MMQNAFALSTIVLYIWWIIINAVVSYAEYHFILQFSGTAINHRSNLLLYIGVNAILTLLTLYFKLPSSQSELLHMVFLWLFSYGMLKIKWRDIIPVYTIIFTILSFTEGIFVVFMRVVVRVTEQLIGMIFQIILTSILVLLFFVTLKVIVKRYRNISNQVNFPYLYILLLPCSFVIWSVRFGLSVDQPMLISNFEPFLSNSPLWRSAYIIGAMATFFVFLEIFMKFITLSNQETEKTLMSVRLREQSLYLAEARQRYDRYRAFQHDINNHLLILSGLFQEGKYIEVEQYFDKLNITAAALLSPISTGNSVLDILLGEKIRYAEQNDITISYSINLPDSLQIDNIDLCIIFSNALDNAIQACLRENQEKLVINVAAKARHQILVIELTNPCGSTAPIIPDTGLKNISHIAKKYQGTMEYDNIGGMFRLSILLCWTTLPSPPFVHPS